MKFGAIVQVKSGDEDCRVVMTPGVIVRDAKFRHVVVLYLGGETEEVSDARILADVEPDYDTRRDLLLEYLVYRADRSR